MAGRLVRNSADRNGVAPYVLLDRGGVVRGYVTPSEGMDLRPYCGRPVTLVGSIAPSKKDQPPHLIADHVLDTAQPSAASPFTHTSTLPPHDPAVRQVAFQEPMESAPANVSAVPPPVGGTRPPSAALRGQPSAIGPQDSPPYAEDGPVSEPQDGVPCPSCGPECPSCEPCDGCCLRPRCGLWVRTDLLLWWTEGMHIPALVTTGQATDPRPGALGEPTTEILFGDSRILDSLRVGGRLQVGLWLNDCQTVGVEGEYLALGSQTDPFRDWSDGTPIISRPYFDVNPDPTLHGQNVEKVAFPRGMTGAIAGSISVDPGTQFQSEGVRLRFILCEGGNCSADPCCDPCGSSFRRELIFGFRHMRLDDGLGIQEELTSTNPSPPSGPSGFVIQDSFATRNDFYGCDLGLLFQSQCGRWSWEFLPKVALGNTHEIANISGSTITYNSAGTAVYFSGRVSCSAIELRHTRARWICRRARTRSYAGIPMDAAAPRHLRLLLHLLESGCKGRRPGRSQRQLNVFAKRTSGPCGAGCSALCLPRVGFLGPGPEFRPGLPLVMGCPAPFRDTPSHFAQSICRSNQ